jgi:hypothetical protein
MLLSPTQDKELEILLFLRYSFYQPLFKSTCLTHQQALYVDFLVPDIRP